MQTDDLQIPRAPCTYLKQKGVKTLCIAFLFVLVSLVFLFRGLLMCDQCWSSCCTFSDGVRNKNTNTCALLLLRTARYKDARRHNTYMLSLGNPVRLLATRCLRSDRHLVPGTCFAAFCGADCAALCLRLLLGDMLWLSELGMCCSDVCRSLSLIHI